MKGQLPNPVQEVYSSDGWTQWNPLLSTENRPAHISSAAYFKSSQIPQFSTNIQMLFYWLTQLKCCDLTM